MKLDHSLKYQEGKDFVSLPSGMQAAKTATVGLILRSNPLSFSDTWRCTGIILENNRILTAAHCLEFKGKILEISIVTSNLSSVKLEAANGDFEKLIPSAYRKTEWINKKYDQRFDQGSDIAIIKVNPRITLLPAAFPRDHLVTTLDRLNESIFTLGKSIYGLGWGSHNQFHFGTGKIDRDSPIEYKQVDSDITVSYVPFFDSCISAHDLILTYSQGLYKANPSYSQGYTFSEEDGYKAGELKSNTNILVIPRNVSNDDVFYDARSDDEIFYDVNLENEKIFFPERGDSGGPVFICSNEACGGPSDPVLIGVVQGGNVNDNYLTTLYNPYFQSIYAQDN